MRRGVTAAVAVALALAATSGCSTRRVAVGALADALGGSGGGTFASDDDPELIRDALPFGLKLQETLLASAPDHRGLLLATARGFASYAYLLQDDASRMEADDRAGAREQKRRASRLYLRGRDYALRGLGVAHPGFRDHLTGDPAGALAEANRDDLDFLYWAAAAQAGALAADPTDAELIADLPQAGAMMERVLALDDAYGAGSAHEFFIAYEASRPGGSLARAREHYARAAALADGRRASVYVSLAENVSVQEQKLGEFRSLLDQALAVDPDRAPDDRLVNVLAQRRARWLRDHAGDLFLDADATGGSP